MTDTTIVINPTGAPATPAEAALIAYLDFRNSIPLPPGWTQSFKMLPCVTNSPTNPGFWTVGDPAAADSCQQAVIACYVESPDYAIELLFLSYRVAGPDPNARPPAGGFRLQFFRRDSTAPTDLEAAGMTRLFAGPAFGLVPVPSYFEEELLDGDPDDLPFPSDMLFDREWHPDKTVTRLLHFALLHPDRKPTQEAVQVVRGRSFPTVIKCNTRRTFRHDLRRSLKRNLKTLRVVQDWLNCRCAMIWPDVPELDREEARKEAQRLEQRYGARRLEAWARLPIPTNVQDTDALMHYLGLAHTEMHGQLAATERLLRRVTSERY